MADVERRPFQRDFQSVVTYREQERSPFMVAQSTAYILDLLHQGVPLDTQAANEYLQTYTLDYLSKAQEGSNILYATGHTNYPSEEVEEAARHAFVTFAWMHVIQQSRFLPHGFSRKGMLRAPATQDEFVGKIRIIRHQLALVATGQKTPHEILEANPNRLTMTAFFRTGAELPLRVPPSSKELEQPERENLEKLLDGIDVSL